MMDELRTTDEADMPSDGRTEGRIYGRMGETTNG